jgi:Branched-chain amino acid transport protein (AzlD)
VTTVMIIGLIGMALINFSFKAAGPVLVGDREPSPAAREMIMGLAPALLAGLVVVELAGPRWADFDWTALPGLAAGGVAYLKGVPDLLSIAIAVGTTVLLRLAVAA